LVVRLICSGKFVDHHCLNFPFITNSKINITCTMSIRNTSWFLFGRVCYECLALLSTIFQLLIILCCPFVAVEGNVGTVFVLLYLYIPNQWFLPWCFWVLKFNYCERLVMLRQRSTFLFHGKMAIVLSIKKMKQIFFYLFYFFRTGRTKRTSSIDRFIRRTWRMASFGRFLWR
jgi:hypothetical protein